MREPVETLKSHISETVRAILPTYANGNPYPVSSMGWSVFTGSSRWRPGGHLVFFCNLKKYAHSDWTVKDIAILRWGSNRKPEPVRPTHPSFFTGNPIWRHISILNFQKFEIYGYKSKSIRAMMLKICRHVALGQTNNSMGSKTRNTNIQDGGGRHLEKYING